MEIAYLWQSIFIFLFKYLCSGVSPLIVKTGLSWSLGHFLIFIVRLCVCESERLAAIYKAAPGPLTSVHYLVFQISVTIVQVVVQISAIQTYLMLMLKADRPSMTKDPLLE